MALHLRVHAADYIYSLRHKECTIAHLILLAVRIVIRIIGTFLDEHLKHAVAVHGRIHLTGGDDVFERITQTVERIKHTRTHLAVHVRCIVIEFVIL